MDHDDGNSMIRPFLKWPGGKRRQLPFISMFCPISDDAPSRWVEPFMGGGSLALNLASRHQEAWVSDACAPLIWLYEEVRRDPHSMMEWLLSQPNTKPQYMAVRAAFNEMLDRSKTDNDPELRQQIARKMIYLSRYGFQGLWRMNRKGYCNVAYGADTLPVDYENWLLQAHDVLKRPSITIRCEHVQPVLERLRNQLLQDEQHEQESKNTETTKAMFRTTLYLDPPYVTDDNPFTAYSVAFGRNEHFALAEEVKRLVERFGDRLNVIVSQPVANVVHEAWGWMPYRHDVQEIRSLGMSGRAGHAPSNITEWMYTTSAGNRFQHKPNCPEISPNHGQTPSVFQKPQQLKLFPIA